jgi:hypothetical protein
MKKTVSITLDRERQLKLDLNAMSEFEELTGKSLFTIGDGLGQARYIRAMLYACMKSAKEEITMDEVGELIDMDNFEYLHSRLNLLMNKSYGEQEATDDKKK